MGALLSCVWPSYRSSSFPPFVIYDPDTSTTHTALPSSRLLEQSTPTVSKRIDSLADQQGLPPVTVPNIQSLLEFIQFQHRQELKTHQLLLDICNPALKLRFRKYLARLPNDLQHVELAFHGTSECRLISIMAQGLLQPGEKNSDGHRIEMANGSGYGPGIYLSPSFNFAQRYVTGVMLVCMVARGRVEKLKLYEQVRKSGIGSYESDSGGQWVFTNVEAVLPIYAINYTVAVFSNEDTGSTEKRVTELAKFVEEGLKKIQRMAVKCEQEVMRGRAEVLHGGYALH